MNLELFESLVLVVHVLAAIAIIGLVLIQHGKGADMGSGLGAGSSSTVFGSTGAGNFLSRSTTWIAVAFFLTSFALAYVAKQKSLEARDLGIPQIIQEVPVGELPTIGDDPVVDSNSEIPMIDSEEPSE